MAGLNGKTKMPKHWMNSIENKLKEAVYEIKF